MFEKINHHLRKNLRVIIGRNLDPSAAIVDSQSVKIVERGGLQVMMELKRLRDVKGTL
ncbi:hypothetical protein NEOC95_002295 [Neochlamydia sp. AcF95]|nr:hypothetical protein [Neochlamydia sp. AcF95]